MIDPLNTRILLVEDDVIIASHQRLMLEKEGYTVLTANTGEKATDLMENTPGISLIIMDINLGDGMSGVETAQRILSKHKVPLIFSSSYTERGIVKKVEEIDTYGFVVKDADMALLVLTVKKALHHFDANQKLIKSEQSYKLAEENIKKLLYEKDIILKEAHHRMKNNFASIESLLSLKLKSSANTGVIHALQDSIGLVKSMRVLYDKLLLTDDPKEVSTKAYIESLFDAMITQFPKKMNITFEKQVDDFKMVPGKLITIGIIINELLNNTIKHAFENRDTGIITMSLTQLKKQVTLTIQDNGIGLPHGFDMNQSKGFGLMIVKMLCQQLMAKLTVENHVGTKFSLEFDVE